MNTPCLFCGGDASERNHRKHCDGQQGRRQALELVPPEPFVFTYDPTGHARTSDPVTSHAAAVSVRKEAGPMAQKILEWIRSGRCGGKTCDELERLTQWSHQTVSRRITDLKEQGYVVDSQMTRRARSRREVIVWVAVEYAEVTR